MKLLKHGDGYNPYGLRMAQGAPFTMEETKAYFRAIRITEDELADLNEWIKDGHRFNRNPWLIYNQRGRPVNFIEASRCIKELYEAHTEQLLVSPTPITDCAFIYFDCPF